MPNWCMNKTIISGPKEAVMEFVQCVIKNAKKDDMGRDAFSVLSTFIPQPDGVDDWYSWSLENWGTKREDQISKIYQSARSNGLHGASFASDTAWSPPLNGYLTISKMWPTLRIVLTFREDGMQFLGAARFQDGKYAIKAYSGEDWPQDYDLLDDEQVDLFEEAINSLIAKAVEEVGSEPLRSPD